MGICASKSVSIIDTVPNEQFINTIGNTFIQGYICDDAVKIELPLELINLIRLFYGEELVTILTFSAVGNNSKHLQLSRLHDNNTHLQIMSNYIDTHDDDDDGLVFVTAKNEFSGRHCWRIYTITPNNDDANILWGVAPPNLIYDWERHAYGVSCLKQCNHMIGKDMQSALKQFYQLQSKCCIDLLLDIDAEKLKICVVNSTGDELSVCFENVFRDQGSGWMPFIYYKNAKDAQFRMAKIPVSLYSKAVPIWSE
eukprot:214384_1